MQRPQIALPPANLERILWPSAANVAFPQHGLTNLKNAVPGKQSAAATSVAADPMM
jgi:hypothetical protein